MFVGLSYGQQVISGKVVSASTGEILPFATITLTDGTGTITDLQGSFKIELPEGTDTLKFSYLGYLPREIRPDTGQYLLVQLEESTQLLDEVSLNANTGAAARIIAEAISRKASNDPENMLNSFSFRSYQKSLITANPDSISGTIDSVFLPKKGELLFKETDSSAYKLKERLSRTHLYMTETAMRVAYQKGEGRKETIIGSKMAGLDEPLYRLLSVQLQSFSFYNETYRLLGTTYKSPLSKTAFNTYSYRILDTTNQQGRPGYLIYYYPKRESNKALLQGVLYIDTVSMALQKGVSQLRGSLEINARQENRYYPEKDIWFPERAMLDLKKGEGNRPVELFDRMLIQVNKSSSDSTERHTNPEQPDKLIRFTTRQYNTDIHFNEPVQLSGRTQDIRVAPLAETQSESFWETRRQQPLSKREENTYLELDSIAAANNINERLDFLNKLFTGYVSTRYIDFDLKYLIKYNDYEAFRLGMGSITNDNFSKRLRLKTYGVYGTKDKDFKYGFTASYRLLPSKDTWFALDYKDDLTETGSAAFLTEGRTFYVFEPRLFNITSFHRNKAFSSFLTHEVNPALRMRIQWTQADTQPTYPYTYVHDGINFTQWETSTLTYSLFWGPNNRYLVSEEGSSLLEPGFPQFNFQVTQGIEGIMGSDFSFTKTQLRIRHDINTFGAGTISLNLTGGMAFGDLPITELYHASPNQPKKDALLQRFSVAGRDSFETMYFDEFFSDRYISMQAKYFLPVFKISERIKPQVIFITRYAIGDIRNIEKHVGIPFNSLENGYYESGVEFNSIFSGFGLSTLYRYGPYSLPRFEDNLSLKFTFYLSLGI
nr:DUF5686 and carboxypeptidase-like regulatory domain-containing protein [Robertkochia marina]